jgi:hypothetical protein
MRILLETFYELADKDYPEGQVPYRALYHALGTRIERSKADSR